ncbi:MAG TPA: ABC transporter substrate-binding protein [Methylomirabilota bacterium]|nr:ABC transporter substrate-binding protein [Methylomirabilota bacterium]
MASRSRRNFLKAAGALAVATSLPAPWTPRAVAQGGSAPLRLGFQVHRTGIGAVYGRWYERTTTAAVKLINEKGGIAGRPIEIVAEDDGTDPKRGAEVVEKLAVQHKVDLIFGTLFSHVVIASAPRAGELKIPYLVVSEGYHVASGRLNRYVFQPGITDVRSQVTAVAPWILKNLGKKVTLIFPDYAFGHDHRDFFSRMAAAQGGTVRALVPIPPTETSFTKYFPRVPADTDVVYHVMVGPGVLTFVKEMGEHFGRRRPQLFGFVDSLEGVDLASPGLEFLEGTYFWEAFPRYASPTTPAHVRTYRERVGVNDSGASVGDPKDVSTFSHMFGCWETLFVIKRAVEQSRYRNPGAGDYKAFVETLEGFSSFPEGLEHPQGAKRFVGRLHQVFGHQTISRVEKRRLGVVHRTAIEDSMYPPEADYTKQPL